LDPRPLDVENTRILLAGLSEARQGFSPLPSVPDELKDIRTIMDGQRIMMNESLDVSGLTDEFKANEYSIFHMATHGVFGGTPEESFLLTYDGRLTMNGLEKLIDIGRFRENPVELLTLSACQTALGNERAALGLAGVAVKAGVRSALATLWYVDDEATSLAVREFYRQLKTPGISKAKALQNAQVKLIKQARYWKPIYWAPFLLIGNWM
ncbi:MAG: CHAT domain-containing protein, partial [Desulfobacterales bacterium]|nr:CHAT domain-containing protein [Desulfobacterales bacterium]